MTTHARVSAKPATGPCLSSQLVFIASAYLGVQQLGSLITIVDFANLVLSVSSRTATNSSDHQPLSYSNCDIFQELV